MSGAFSLSPVPSPSDAAVSATARHSRLGVAVEAVGEVPQQQQRRGAERREPKALAVEGAGVVAEGIDHRVGPGDDDDPVGRRGVLPWSHERGTV